MQPRSSPHLIRAVYAGRLSSPDITSAGFQKSAFGRRYPVSIAVTWSSICEWELHVQFVFYIVI